MQEPATAPWGLSISETDLDKLKAGLEPEFMEDRWHITFSDQGQKGTSSIHFTRSWTGNEIYVLFVKSNEGGSTSSRGGKVEAITWEQDTGSVRTSEEQAKKEVVFYSRVLLKCEFEALPEYKYEDVLRSRDT